MTAQPRVAVVGAGSAGLATLKALRDAGVAAVAYESADTVGGLWVYGAPGSPAYRTLHLNTSRGRTQFADHPMPADWPDYRTTPASPATSPTTPTGSRCAR